MKTTSITRRLFLLMCAFMIVISATVGFYSWLLGYLASQSEAMRAALDAQHTRVYRQLESFAALQNEVQRLLREKDIDKLETMVKEFQAHQASLQEQIGGHAAASPELPALFGQWNQSAGTIIEQFLTGNVADANNLLISELTPRFAKVLEALQKDRDASSAALTAQRSSQAARLMALRTRTLLAAVGAMALLATGAWFLKRGIVQQLCAISEALQRSSELLAAVSAQLTTASQSASEGATNQAASLEETSASLEQITGRTHSNAENAGQAQTLADAAQKAAAAGQEQVRQMVQTMEALANAGKQIESILKAIDTIAFQTNLLALNAAVEAARAGEAGRGFAVVASEVRALAQRSAEAARQTAAIIGETLEKTQGGAAVSHRVAERLGEIHTRATSLNQLVSQIAVAAKEQSTGVSQINTALAEIGKVTQANSANAVDTARAAEQLNTQLAAVHLSCEQLAVLIDGGRIGRAAAAEPLPAAPDEAFAGAVRMPPNGDK